MGREGSSCIPNFPAASSRHWRSFCSEHHSPPLLLPPGPGQIAEFGLCQGIARHACPSAMAKRQEGQSWGFPAPSQLPKCSALLMKRPLFLSLQPCALIYRPFDNQLQTRSARPSHQLTKACALWAECSTSLLGGFL